MRPDRVTVLLPCHGIDDFPTWLEDAESDQLLTAWTAAWHPAIIAATGRPPAWASLDGPPPEPASIGIIPAGWDDRFTGDSAELRWVRQQDSSPAIARAAAALLGIATDSASWAAGDRGAEDFQAAGLGVLLAELLAHRMRTGTDLSAAGFDEAIVTAARAAVAGDAEEAERALAEAFACLATTRSRYYPVDCWLLDVILLAGSTTADALRDELASPVPAAVVATGATIERLAAEQPATVAALREAVASGRLEPCGGRDLEGPLESCPPEQLERSLARGRDAWRRHVGRAPDCYAAITGGSAAVLPQPLAACGYRAAIWSLFDGSPLPEPGSGLIRWESGGCHVATIAGTPLDVSRPRSVLELPDRLGDAMDHDHVAVVPLARYAGGASRWHRLLQRLGGRSDLLGSFVTPTRLVERAGDAATPTSFEPDAFPPADPAQGETAAAAALETTDRIRDASRRALAAAAGARRILAGGPAAVPAAAAAPPPDGRRWLPAGLFGRRRDDDALILDNGLVRVRPHPQTGGLLSLRRPADRSNRISQQLAIRTAAEPRPGEGADAGAAGSSVRMEAGSVVRCGDARHGTIESRGRLLAASGREAGRFTQRMRLVAGLPLAVIELEVTAAEPLAGPLFDGHVSCRFAWHENDDVELRRSICLQSAVTERTRFTAGHFVEIVPAGPRTAADSVVILTGGLLWQQLSEPHVLDVVIPPAGRTASARLAVGIGLARPWEAGLALAAGEIPQAGARLPDNVRLIGVESDADEPAAAGGLPARRAAGIVVGLVESAGRRGEVAIEWARPVMRAAVVDGAGRPVPDIDVAVAGRTTRLRLERFQWLRLAIEFGGDADAAGPEGAAA